MAEQDCIPSTQKAEAEGSQVPERCNEDVSQNNNTKVITDTNRKIYTLTRY